MADSKTMMLAKKLDTKKLKFPVFVSPKLDGVPVVISCDELGRAVAHTRQGEQVVSIDHILHHFTQMWSKWDLGHEISFVGELHNKHLPFKDISGMVRRQDGTCADVSFNMFDAFFNKHSGMGYKQRILYCLRAEEMIATHDVVRTVDMAEVTNERDLMYSAEHYINGGAEGAMVRDMTHPYEIGKRSWGMMKIKAEPTVDLSVVGFEEAVSKDGEPLGMVGRVNVLYKGKTIGAGPGNMNHAERVAVWQRRHTFIGKIAEIKYMEDESYEALREARFVCWRPDKAEESYE